MIRSIRGGTPQIAPAAYSAEVRSLNGEGSERIDRGAEACVRFNDRYLAERRGWLVPVTLTDKLDKFSLTRGQACYTVGFHERETAHPQASRC